MDNHWKKIKFPINNDDVPIKMKVFTFNHEDADDQRQLTKDEDIYIETDEISVLPSNQQKKVSQKVKRKDDCTQTELTSIMLDEEQTYFPLYSTIKDIDTISHQSHKSSKINLQMYEEDIFDQKHVTITKMMSDQRSDTSHRQNRRVVETNSDRRTFRTSTITGELKMNRDPIIGYAQEPLLPLFKACAPLMNIIPNLLFYIQIALNGTPEVPSDGLTIEESAAIRLYTIEWNDRDQSLYTMLNHTLKSGNREQLQPYFKYLKLFLTALAKLPCVPQSTVWRGVTKDLNEEFSPGTVITWWAFSSCTDELTVLNNKLYLGTTGTRTLFSVETINGRTISDHSYFATEDEVLLLPGTRMIVHTKFSPTSDLHIIHLKQLRPTEILLEPPFEGNL